MVSTSQHIYDSVIQTLRQHRVWNATALMHKWLAPSHPMDLTSKLQQLTTLKGWLDSFRPLPPAVIAELKQRYDVRFTYSSNAIEGNTLTQSETELILENGITIGGKTLTEHLEVIGHKEAIDYIEQLAQQEQTLGEWEIKQIHALILRKIAPAEAGTYRTVDVQASGTQYQYPPHYLLPDLMHSFADWLESEVAQQLHPVCYAAEAHIRFVSIHPFRDGNGRAGRLLMNLLLLRQGYPLAIIGYEQRQRYIESLIQGQQANNWQPFLHLVADATQQSFVEILSLLATAADNRGKALPFYQALLKFLQAQDL